MNVEVCLALRSTGMNRIFFITTPEMAGFPLDFVTRVYYNGCGNDQL